MEDEPGPTSIADRIAALKLGQVGRLPTSAAPTNNTTQSRRPPPTLPARTNSTHGNGLANAGTRNEPSAPPPKPPAGKIAPTLPPRNASDKISPALPPRRPSESPSLPPRRTSEALSPQPQFGRRGSRDSIASTVSSYSLASTRTSTSIGTTSSSNGSTYTIRAPVYDPASLPPLPPKNAPEPKGQLVVKPGVTKAASAPAIPQRPQLPQRQSISPSLPAIDRPVVQAPKRSALLQGFGSGKPAAQPDPASRECVPPPMPERRESTPALPARQLLPPPVPSRGSSPAPTLPARDQLPLDAPPPIPRASRPTTTSLSTSPAPKSSTECLQCKDFTPLFTHASRFPRHPGLTPSVLAAQLAAPYASATEKAFVLFAWLHHNIAYDAASFLAGNIRPSTPNSTLATGLAVCEGYAGLFAALATSAGLEVVVLNGHGKGYGYTHPSGAPHKKESNHAWNAVKLETGWKLLDSCWGAGHLDGGAYVKHWHPEWFTLSNEEFARKHFPSDERSWFWADGRGYAWGEYISLTEEVRIYDGVLDGEGIGRPTVTPREREVSLASGMVRLGFEVKCPHWNWRTHGRGEPYLYLLQREGAESLPLNTDGRRWWIDVPARELGQAGKEVQIVAMTSYKGGNARGLTAAKYKADRGRVSMGWQGVCAWLLVA